MPDVETFDAPSDDPLFSQFAGVFAKFQEQADEADGAVKEPEKPEAFFGDEDLIQDEEEEAETKKKLSRKARKAATKLSVAELKAIVRKPEIVDWTDTSSQDPKLLVNIKATRNVIPVPTHWQLKREYLSSKRGIEKQTFKLPPFIAETGIAEMRQSALDNQAEATLKQKQRERVNPGMNRLDIDYYKLHDAFFRRQTKPHLTRYGEIYYEGKEYETNLRHLRPGELSDTLREALNMPLGAPPPWLINMQRIGPPPSYPAMRIPGVTAPPPPGAKWGFEPGGYGKAPTNPDGTPMWGGDLTGIETAKQGKEKKPEPPIQRDAWGEIQIVEDEEEEAAEEEEEEEEDEAAEEGKEEEIGSIETPADGIATSSGIYTSTGMKSMAEEFDLRKNRRGTETEDSSHPRSAGQVLQERSIRAEGFFGGERAYDLGNANLPVLGSDSSDRNKKRKAGDLDVSVDVDALVGEDGLSKDEIKRRYEETREREKHGQWNGKVDQEDLSRMIAEEGAKRLKKNQEQRSRRR